MPLSSRPLWPRPVRPIYEAETDLLGLGPPRVGTPGPNIQPNQGASDPLGAFLFSRGSWPPPLFRFGGTGVV